MKKRKGRNKRKLRKWHKGWAKMERQIERAHAQGKITKGTRRFFPEPNP